MKKRKIQRYFIFTVGSLLLVFIIGLQSFTKQKNIKPKKTGGNNMELYCNAFTNEAFISKKFSCKGEDVNPELTWENVPKGTKSFALSVKDPDAPIGTFVHWLVYDIDKNAKKVEENSVPGKQVENNFGKQAYGGPCPPSGVHRYYFRLFALDVESLGDINSMDEFDKKVEEHTIARAELMGKFEK